ncbi:N-acyl homoserine lactonase family protein [Brevibacterium sp. VCM10]|uniref:N-acyl homoserine lactonase family protein n=1 Tax=Brevibacterium sp. VCM10 TaxID=1381751 RepID=UPI00046EB58E|nr:N-acyl homoserine lactonase family protein [Brevibacterium sp. VCM10]
MTIQHLWALDAPTISTDGGLFQLGTGGSDLAVPIPTFLIQHEGGLLVFDTGLATDAAGDPARAYGPLAEAFDMSFPPEARIDTQLESLGFSTSDVTDVVLSHMHFDHTGGLELFPTARGFIGEGELAYSRSPRRLDAAMYREEDIAAAGQIDWLEIPQGVDHDIFGDGSVVVLSMPGHTHGTLSLKLSPPDHRTIILTSDAAHLQSNIDETTGMPLDVDTRNKERSLRRLRLLASQPNTTVWANHDPDHWKQFRREGRQIV